LHVNQTNLRNAGSALQSSITEKYNDQAIGDFQADDDFYFNPGRIRSGNIEDTLMRSIRVLRRRTIS
jgi:hypothetical protein